MSKEHINAAKIIKKNHIRFYEHDSEYLLFDFSYCIKFT
jgi:hypothetical protein